MNCFAGLMIQLFQVGAAECAQLQLPDRRLAQGHAGDAQVVIACSIASEEPRRFEVYEETVQGAGGQAREFDKLRRAQRGVRFRQQAQNAQPALKGCNVVSAFSGHFHGAFSQVLTGTYTAKNESPTYLVKKV